MNYKLICSAILLTSSLSYAETKETLPEQFYAVYDGYYKGDKVGRLTREFKKENDGSYSILSHSEVDGYYGIIPVSDNRKEISFFNIDNNLKYHPISYKMDRTGTWLDFVMDIKFNYDTKKVNFSYKDRKEERDMVGNILDNALYQLRLQHEIKNGNRDSIQYDIAYKTGFRDFHFKYEKDEVLNTKFGKTKSLKYYQVRSNKKGEQKATYTWFDPSKDFVMNKFIYYNKKGKEEARFELVEYRKK